jgi:hypothetical protein
MLAPDYSYAQVRKQRWASSVMAFEGYIERPRISTAADEKTRSVY